MDVNLKWVFWFGSLFLCILGWMVPNSARAEQRVCAQGMEIKREDVDARLMRRTPNSFWFVEQRTRLCQAAGGTCAAWTAPGRFLELAVENKRQKKYYRYSFRELALDVKVPARGRNRLLATQIGRGDFFEVGQIKKSALLRDYEYSIASGPGYPTENYQISIWRIRKRGALKYEVSDDFRQACILY